MTFREPLPKSCPPPEATECAAPTAMYRLIRDTHPSRDDFHSWRALNPEKPLPPNQTKCVARGLSLWGCRRRRAQSPQTSSFQKLQRTRPPHAHSRRGLFAPNGVTPAPHMVALRHLRPAFQRPITFRMKTIQHTSTLLYYDAPQIFEARDDIVGHYLAVMVEPENGSTNERYLVVGVNPEKLCRFRKGTLDLLTLILQRGEAQWYLTENKNGLGVPLELHPRNADIEKSDFLPAAEFFHRERPALDVALRKAHSRKKLCLGNHN